MTGSSMKRDPGTVLREQAIHTPATPLYAAPGKPMGKPHTHACAYGSRPAATMATQPAQLSQPDTAGTISKAGTASRLAAPIVLIVRKARSPIVQCKLGTKLLRPV